MPLPSADFWYGVAITALAGILTYFFGVRRRRLTVTHDVTTLIPRGGEKLAVTWDGREVPDPFLVDMQLEASLAGDITPASFEGGGLSLDLGDAKVIGVLSTEGSPPCSASESELAIEPFLLKRGKAARVTCLASGKRAGVARVSAELSDTSVVVRSQGQWRTRASLAVGIAYVAMGAILALTAAAIQRANLSISPISLSDFLWIIAGVITGSGLGVMVGGPLRDARSRRRHSKLLGNKAQKGGTAGTALGEDTDGPRRG